MSQAHHSPPVSSTEPRSFHGYVPTTTDAFRLVLAAQHGIIPRITRRLNDAERRSMVKSGAVFIFDVEESGIKRWTEGRLWSPSRIVGNFLVYRELNERANYRKGQEYKPAITTTTAGVSSSAAQMRGISRNIFSFSVPQFERGFSVEQETLKPGGLIKKTITVTIKGSNLHLIAYYTQADVQSGKLKGVSHRSDIMSMDLRPELFQLSTLRFPPKVEKGPYGEMLFAPETNDFDHLEFPTQTSMGDRNQNSEPLTMSLYTMEPDPHQAAELSADDPNYPYSPEDTVSLHSMPSPMEMTPPNVWPPISLMPETRQASRMLPLSPSGAGPSKSFDHSDFRASPSSSQQAFHHPPSSHVHSVNVRRPHAQPEWSRDNGRPMINRYPDRSNITNQVFPAYPQSHHLIWDPGYMSGSQPIIHSPARRPPTISQSSALRNDLVNPSPTITYPQLNADSGRGGTRGHPST